MSIDDLLLKSLEYARDTSTQLLSLAAVIIAASVTISQDIFRSDDRRAQRALVIAWGLFLLSVLAGVFALLSMTGNLAIAAGGRVGVVADEPFYMLLSPYEPKIRLFTTLQLLSFVAASGMLVRFGVLKIRGKTPAIQPTTEQ